MQKGRCGPLMVQGESNMCISKRDGGEIHSPPVMVESLLEIGISGFFARDDREQSGVH